MVKVTAGLLMAAGLLTSTYAGSILTEPSQELLGSASQEKTDQSAHTVWVDGRRYEEVRTDTAMGPGCNSDYDCYGNRKCSGHKCRDGRGWAATTDEDVDTDERQCSLHVLSSEADTADIPISA